MEFLKEQCKELPGNNAHLEPEHKTAESSPPARLAAAALAVNAMVPNEGVLEYHLFRLREAAVRACVRGPMATAFAPHTHTFFLLALRCVRLLPA